MDAKFGFGMSFSPASRTKKALEKILVYQFLFHQNAIAGKIQEDQIADPFPLIQIYAELNALDVLQPSILGMTKLEPLIPLTSQE